MRRNYSDMPNGYQETIQKGLNALNIWGRDFFFGKGTREDSIWLTSLENSGQAIEEVCKAYQRWHL